MKRNRWALLGRLALLLAGATAWPAPAGAQVPDSGSRARAAAAAPGRPSGSARARRPARAKPPRYAVYAIEYGVTRSMPVRGFLPGADSTRRMDLAFMFWLIRGPNGRNVLVDGGFYDPRTVAQWRVTDFVLPSRAILRAGVAPEEVTDLVLTHAHFDHAGGVDLFPKARIWIQREEYDSATAGPGRRGELGMDATIAARLVQFREAGRVRLLDGASEILPGIRAFPRGGHTWACQYLAVNTRAGVVVLASDNVPTYENLERRLPNALAIDSAANRRALELMLRLAARPALVVPGHDPEVFRRFPRPGSGIARID